MITRNKQTSIIIISFILGMASIVCSIASETIVWWHSLAFCTTLFIIHIGIDWYLEYQEAIEIEEENKKIEENNQSFKKNKLVEIELGGSYTKGNIKVQNTIIKYKKNKSYPPKKSIEEYGVTLTKEGESLRVEGLLPKRIINKYSGSRTKTLNQYMDKIEISKSTIEIILLDESESGYSGEEIYKLYIKKWENTTKRCRKAPLFFRFISLHFPYSL